MAYSTQSAVSDGTLSVLPLSIDYLSRDDITVYLGSAQAPAGSWAWVGTIDRSIKFTPAVPKDVTVTIKRSTGVTGLYHKFAGGAQFTSKTLDESLTQTLFVAQEFSESSSVASDDLPLPVGSQASAGKSNRYARADHVHVGMTGGSVGSVVQDNFVGDGVKLAFTLQNTPTTKGSTQVYIDSVYQSKAAYTLAGPTITFDEAPAVGAVVEVITVTIGGGKASDIQLTETPEMLNADTGGNVQGALSWIAKWMQKLGAGTGGTLISLIKSGAGAVKRTLLDLFDERPSVLDYASPAARAGGDYASAFAALFVTLAATGRTGYVPGGTYNVGATLDIPAGVSLEFAPSVVLNYTPAAGSVLRIRKGVKCIGNGAKITIANAAWDDPAILLDGSDKFKADAETVVAGFGVTGAGTTKGCGLQLRALNGGEYISFVKLRNFTFNNLKYGLLVSCGGGADTGAASWHWINSNLMENFTFFGTQFGMSVVGLPTTPAEVAGNQFLNFHFQPGTGMPVYFYGASWNTLTGYIWDWSYATSGASIQFDGGAKWNTCRTNIYIPQISGTANNKCYDLSGDETGQKFFHGEVYHLGRTHYGLLATSGQYAVRYLPDTSGGGVFWTKNSGNNFEFGAGADPYAGTQFYSIDGLGRMTYGGGGNASLSKFRVNGEVNKSVMALRMGTDGYGAILLENAAGTNVGTVACSSTATTYGTSSDYRLKHDVQDLQANGSFIDRLRPVTWRWNVDDSLGVGFIAHELQAVSPGSVHGVKDAVDEEGAPLYQTVEYGSAEMVAYLVAELQNVRRRLAALER